MDDWPLTCVLAFTVQSLISLSYMRLTLEAWDNPKQIQCCVSTRVGD